MLKVRDVVLESFCVSSLTDNRLRGLLGIMSAEMILEFALESNPRRSVAFTLLEDVANVCCKGHETQKLLAEQALALFCAALAEEAASRSELD